jgi:histidine triad (HIT) family protein
MDCLFCKIVAGQIPSTKVYEDDKIVAFKDIEPQAPVHVLVIPKEHIAGMAAVTEKNAEILATMLIKIPEIAKSLGIFESGFRVVSNSGEDARQTVPHLHFHILGGTRLSGKMV